MSHRDKTRCMSTGYPAYNLTGACISTDSSPLLTQFASSIMRGQGLLHAKDAACMEATQVALLDVKLISYIHGAFSFCWSH